jgi:hypothetical protein
MEKMFYGCLLYILLLDAVQFSPSEGRPAEGSSMVATGETAMSGIWDLAGRLMGIEHVTSTTP